MMKDQNGEYFILGEMRESKDILVGNRIPYQYFETSGTGESDIAIHAGSYHLALQNATIGQCNIMTYSSILPGVAEKVESPETLKQGAVLEAIMSVCHANKGEIATAGIICGWLIDQKTGKKHGGLVCEHAGNYDEPEIKQKLTASLDELFESGYADQYNMKDIDLLVETLIPVKKYGTALVALCFTSYYYPIIPDQALSK